MQKLLKSFLILGACSFFVASCGSKAPALTFCVLRVVDGEPIELFCSHKELGDSVIPIEEADKFVCQPRRDAELLRNYVLNLERKAARCN